MTFQLLRSEPIESLAITVEEYEHSETGASHIHLAADNNENVFLVALRTVPQNSTGVAHILEHTALCGSKKYPVRDPFFMMIKRSLNTFMNAFTSSDWTAYPFASQNKKDFNNLLDVYLDAVFFSRLDPLDFAQEGHRVEFEEAGNTDSPLVYKGVVFNEMKGALSSVPMQLWYTLCKYLYPTTTYHHNSGGDPEAITDLSYEQLKNFYQSHYHPSNAMFMTYGDIPAATHQEKFEQQALQHFQRLDNHIHVPPEKRYHAPIRVQESYPYNEGDDLSGKTHLVMAWLLGPCTDAKSALEAQLLTGVLLDNSASPLQQALETTDLGTAPSPVCGLDDSQYEAAFVCGLEGSEAERADEFEKLVMDTIASIAHDGISEDTLNATLHQLELQQRDITGDNHPYGLQLILTALNANTHRGQAIELLNLDQHLESLREQIKDPDYIKQLARRLLLDNPHRVRITFTPDGQIAERKQAAEAAKLAAIKNQLSADEKQRIVELAQQLNQRQNAEDDPSILPKVGLEDVTSPVRELHPDTALSVKAPITGYRTGTNGLSYQQAIMTLPALSNDQLQLLPLYTSLMAELGVGDANYLQTQQRQAQVVGSLSAYASMRASANAVDNYKGFLVLSAKALGRNHQAMTELMADTLYNIRFDEHQRIRELIAQIRARKEQGVTASGHALAMSAAAAGLSPLHRLTHRNSGLHSIQHIKKLDQQLNDAAALATLSDQLVALHQTIIAQPLQFLLISDAESLDSQAQVLSQHWPATQPFIDGQADASVLGAVELPAVDNGTIKQNWQTGTQVNFCARAYPTVPVTHTDAAPLTILGGVLRNGYLHRAIREQGGAYGGGAQHDNNGAFKFYSYRDPRCLDTLADFSRSIEWLLEKDHPFALVEESILGVIGSLDKPLSPAGEAKQAFHTALHGRTKDIRQQYRDGILNTTMKDLQRVAATYLTEDKANTAVITDQGNSTLAEQLGLENVKL